MTKLIDMQGKVFGRWEIISRYPSDTEPKWLCKCFCESERVISGRSLRNQKSSICLCFTSELNYSEEFQRLVIEEYNDICSAREIGLRYGLSCDKIVNILKKQSVPLRNSRSKVKCNRQFFSTYNSKSCYWAGFILADGNLRKNSLRFCLATKDESHLIKFLDSIDCLEHDRVKTNTKRTTLDICLKDFYDDLQNNFEIFPRKTFTGCVSEKIPRQFLSDFVRGMFDGDGCITGNKTSAHFYYVGNQEVLNFLRDLFYNQLEIRLKSKNIVPPILRLKNNIGSISYTCKNAIRIFAWMYEGSNKTNRLSRKYEKYIAFK